MKVSKTLAFYPGPVMPLRADGAPMEKVYPNHSVLSQNFCYVHMTACPFEFENLVVMQNFTTFLIFVLRLATLSPVAGCFMSAPKILKKVGYLRNSNLIRIAPKVPS